MKTVVYLLAMITLLASGPVSADSLYGNRIKRWTAQAEKGKANYQYKLGNAYLKGNEVSKNEKTAADWFRKAAKQNYAKAQYKLGYLYYVGKGVRRNYSLAFRWLNRAARSNYSPAQYYLGKLYAEGKGTDQDLDKAMSWLRKASKAGYTPANQEIARVRNLIARAERAAATPAPAPARPRPAPRPRPRPRRTRRSNGKSDYKTILLSSNWVIDRKPAEHLPSRLNKCKTDGSNVVCTSAQLKRFTGAAEVTYRVETTVSDPNGTGNFLLSYRVHNIFVLPDDADDPNPKGEIPATGWTKSTLLRCKFRNRKSIECLDSDKKKELYTLRKRR